MPTRQNIKNIWMITREYGSLAGAGGVKDVSKQLAEALARDGRDVHVVLPCYGFMNPRDAGFVPSGMEFFVDMCYATEERREFVKIWRRCQNPDIFLIDSQRFREKHSVYTYTADDAAQNPSLPQGSGHFDYFAMNLLLQKTALNLMIRMDQRPDIIHCHDGHTAVLPAMIREREGFRHYFHNTGCVVTIHNAGQSYHQEVADLPFAQAITGLPLRVIRDNQLDGSFDPFLAASQYCVLNTVSENYARELRETYDDELTGWLGHRLMARGVCLEGVTNGINPADYDPSKPEDLGLPAGYSAGGPKSGGKDGKEICKEELIDTLLRRGLANVEQDGWLDQRPGQPLFSFIGRFTAQKGVDKMMGALKKLLPIDQDFQILILGTGDKLVEADLAELANDKDFQGRVCVLRGYDPVFANQIYAAGDFFLVPSRYEPCGLTDFMAQLFGNIPVVHHIGGLVKVIDGETGFAYTKHSSDQLAQTMKRAIDMFRSSPEKIMDIRRQAVERIDNTFTWDTVMRRYLELYEEALRFKGN